MAEQTIVVIAGYQPPWNNALRESPAVIREHLIAEHHFAAALVSRLSDAQCWEAHDSCHEAQLGGTLLLT